MATGVAAGAGGFCIFAVLLHPAFTEIVAASRGNKIHCLVATANLLELSCVSIGATELALELACQLEAKDQLALQFIAPYLAGIWFADHRWVPACN